ncbi:hypothetical protein ACFC0N_35330 [Streptomyces zaomyceticus]|uniref:hypothetical protein n=1 Tax=Streptomyces zaomyceticus TaxID=68286 RepID=UPI0035DEF9F5
MSRSPAAFRSITFAAWRDAPPRKGGAAARHYVTLAELLVRLGGFGLGLTWKVQIHDIPTSEVEKASAGAGIGTLQLLARVAPDRQFIDGDFAGYEGDELRVVLREFDSTSWDLCTDDDAVLAEFSRQYPDAAPTPEDVLQEIPWPTDLREPRPDAPA